MHKENHIYESQFVEEHLFCEEYDGETNEKNCDSVIHYDNMLLLFLCIYVGWGILGVFYYINIECNV